MLSEFEWEDYSTKEERRGSGRRSNVPTGKSREKRNCSRGNHGCHGYVREKSRSKAKGMRKGSQHVVDVTFSWGQTVFWCIGNGELVERSLRC